MTTPIIHTSQVPPKSIWCIGQSEHTPKWRREMDRKVRRGEYLKVRASWQSISGLKTVYIKLDSGEAPVRPVRGLPDVVNASEPQP